MEVLHRYGHETLLWDEVGTGITDSDADEVARLLLAAAAGDSAAEDHLERQFQTDPKLRPAPTVTQLSPYGDPSVTIHLTPRPRP
ncbi:hypothetical protein E1218_24225 [Kribbella turkmenica]|uniref:Uncharacterized protein n=1 Tax=Kribbella turkmenica TaxID=2530375 RepID=A0A4R4WNH1_9ACTN|nr:hypothetical protein [Kribbella turkmenica]TDD19347.1 hypothetical protein E1218_24225 [Kribbella turkmenica]